jgi:hypothetical protein
MFSTFNSHHFRSPRSLVAFFALLIVSQSICLSSGLRQPNRLTIVQSDLIDEIDAKKLEKLVQEKESVALYLCMCRPFAVCLT